MTTTPPIDKAALADRLEQLSEDLYAAAGDMRALGYPLHASELGGTASHARIYSHQMRAKVRMDAELRGGA
jgi:hypothetical protein